MSPGSSFGTNGEGYVRFSLIHGEEKMKKAVAVLKKIF
jgi:aspartate/methionine/tyrosine aminotransferase